MQVGEAGALEGFELALGGEAANPSETGLLDETTEAHEITAIVWIREEGAERIVGDRRGSLEVSASCAALAEWSLGGKGARE